jgi:hypothetical protein
MEGITRFKGRHGKIFLQRKDLDIDSCFMDIMRRSTQYWLFCCRKIDIFELFQEVSDCWQSPNEYIAHTRGITDHLNYKAIVKTAIKVHSELKEGEEKKDLEDKIKIALNSVELGILPCYFDFGV